MRNTAVEGFSVPLNDYNSSAESIEAKVKNQAGSRPHQKKVTDIQIMNAAHTARIQRILNQTSSNSKEAVDPFTAKFQKLTSKLS